MKYYNYTILMALAFSVDAIPLTDLSKLLLPTRIAARYTHTTTPACETKPDIAALEKEVKKREKEHQENKSLTIPLSGATVGGIIGAPFIIPRFCHLYAEIGHNIFFTVPGALTVGLGVFTVGCTMAMLHGLMHQLPESRKALQDAKDKLDRHRMGNK